MNEKVSEHILKLREGHENIWHQQFVSECQMATKVIPSPAGEEVFSVASRAVLHNVTVALGLKTQHGHFPCVFCHTTQHQHMLPKTLGSDAGLLCVTNLGVLAAQAKLSALVETQQFNYRKKLSILS